MFEYIWMVVVGIAYIVCWALALWDFWVSTEGLERFDVLGWFFNLSYYTYAWVGGNLFVLCFLSFIMWLIKG